MKITPGFSAAHVLRDGTPVTIRFIRPEDRDELVRCFGRLSPVSRYRRFLSARDELSDEALDYLTRVDGVGHVALVAVTDSPDLKTDQGLGIARFVRLRDEPAVAEAAVTVLDDVQGKGLGTLLLRTLADAARERGIEAFRGEVLASNLPMRRMLDEVGAKVIHEDADSVLVDVALGAGDEAGATILGRVLRVVATALASVRALALPNRHAALAPR
jgi:GNAT superfamily N-acetyltransferase